MRKLVNMRLDEGLLARVDSVCGPRGRTEFVARALEAALSDAKGPVAREQASPGPVGSVPAKQFRSEPVREAAPPQGSSTTIQSLRRELGARGFKTVDADALARQARLNRAKGS